MSIGKFEFLHGAALARLLRKDQPVTLTLIETNTKESWSAYKTMGGKTEIIIYMKYSTSPRKKAAQATISWTFNFSEHNIQEIVKLNKDMTSVVLICAGNDFSEQSELCWISNENLKLLIDFDKKEMQTLTVTHEKGKSLRVYSSYHRDKIIVNKDEIDKVRL